MADHPVLNQVNIVVTDMNATVAFYRRLGLSIAETAPEWATRHRTASMPHGIEFARAWDEGWAAAPRMGVLGFAVASRQAVDETYDDLIGAGYKGEQTPYDAFGGARYAIVQDPDGKPVGIMSPV